MPASPPPVRASTPCIRICSLDPETEICEGCGRTLDEIRQWGRMNEQERLAVMDGLDERMRRASAASPETA